MPSHYQLLWLAVLVVNLACTVELAHRLVGRQPGWDSHTYIGLDFPTRAKIDTPSVEMTFEETVHYPVDGPLAQEEWLSIRAGRRGHQGYTHLGPERRTFILAMFHEYHCMNTIRLALLDHDNSIASHHHVQHCLNYMRQLFLCSADATLEPYDFLLRNYEKDRVGVTRQCRDWSTVYADVSANWDVWRAEMEAEGKPTVERA